MNQRTSVLRPSSLLMVILVGLGVSVASGIDPSERYEVVWEHAPALDGRRTFLPSPQVTINLTGQPSYDPALVDPLSTAERRACETHPQVIEKRDELSRQDPGIGYFVVPLERANSSGSIVDAAGDRRLAVSDAILCLLEKPGTVVHLNAAPGWVEARGRSVSDSGGSAREKRRVAVPSHWDPHSGSRSASTGSPGELKKASEALAFLAPPAEAEANDNPEGVLAAYDLDRDGGWDLAVYAPRTSGLDQIYEVYEYRGRTQRPRMIARFYMHLFT